MPSHLEISRRIDHILQAIADLNADYSAQLIENLSQLHLNYEEISAVANVFLILPKLIEQGLYEQAVTFINLFKSFPRLLLHRDEFGKSALLIALLRGAYEVATLLTKQLHQLELNEPLARVWEEVNVSNSQHLLHLATANPDILRIVLKRMIDEGATEAINQIDNDWNTPLHIAAKRANRSISIALINAGADLSIYNKQNQSALYFFSGDSERGAFGIAVFNGLTPENQNRFLKTYALQVQHAAPNSVASQQFISITQLFSLKSYILTRFNFGLSSFNPRHKQLIKTLCNEVGLPTLGQRFNDGLLTALPQVSLSALQYSDQTFQYLIDDINQDLASLRQERPYVPAFRVWTALLSVILIGAAIGGGVIQVRLSMIASKNHRIEEGKLYILDRNYAKKLFNGTNQEYQDARKSIQHEIDKFLSNGISLELGGGLTLIIGTIIAILTSVVIFFTLWNRKRTVSQHEARKRLSNLADQLQESLNKLQIEQPNLLSRAELQALENKLIQVKSSTPLDIMIIEKENYLNLINPIKSRAFHHGLVLFKPQSVNISIAPATSKDEVELDEIIADDALMPLLQRVPVRR